MFYKVKKLRPTVRSKLGITLNCVSVEAFNPCFRGLVLGGGDGRDAINCVSTAKHKKGRTRFIKGTNTIIIKANTRFAPTVCVLLNGLYWGIGGWGLCGAQNQLRITNYV